MEYKDGQLLRVKVIKTEADLPKEDTLCYCSYNDKILKMWFRLKDWSIKNWLDNVNWYLQPIEEQKPESPVYDEKYLDECIEKATPNLSKIKDVDKTLAEIRGDEPELEPSQDINEIVLSPAYEEPELTAEEILDQYFEETGYDVDPIQRKFVLQAMEQYRNEGLREELLKFNSWMCGKQYDGLIPLIETCIDEYLSNKQNYNDKT